MDEKTKTKSGDTQNVTVTPTITSITNGKDKMTDNTPIDSTAVSTRKDATTVTPQKDATGKFPKIVWVIIVIEFCERFSFYGMRSVLTRYLIFLGYQDHAAAAAFHSFVVICYFATLPGAIISDSFLGKYRTILYISTLYAIGQTILAVASVNQSAVISIIALLMIGIGTGGIKPCVSAFGGDQFIGRSQAGLQHFFALFYLSINLGALLSILVTPIVRNISCLNSVTCYPIAFGLPAVAMWCSVVMFFLFRSRYVIIHVKDNVIVKSVSAIWHAMWKKQDHEKKYWLYKAEDKYDKQFLEEVKRVIAVLTLFIPLPFFWALFDQQSSTWFIQSLKLDNRIFGFEIIEEQVSLVNPVAIVILVPLFSYYVYPLFEKVSFLRLPHHRIILGGCVAALSFLIAATLEFAIQSTPPISTSVAKVTILNAAKCPLTLDKLGVIPPHKMWTMDYYVTDKIDFQAKFQNCPEGSAHLEKDLQISLQPQLGNLNLAIVYMHKANAKVKFDSLRYNASALSSLLVPLMFSSYEGESKANLTLDSLGETHFASLESTDGEPVLFGSIMEASSNTYTVHLQRINSKPVECGKTLTRIGRFYMLLVGADGKCYLETMAFPRINIMWQCIQLLVISVGEVMYSVTGLEMSYDQAPVSMKSIVQAGWTLTVAVGNIIVILVEALRFTDNEALTYAVYGVLMFVDMAAFYVLCKQYTYVKSDDFATSTAGVTSVTQDTHRTN